MNYVAFRTALREFPVFSLADIRSVDPAFDRRRLSEWQEKAYIRKITRGLYLFTDVNLDEERLFSIANKVYSPSYISLQSALSFHRLIPESLYAVTSVSTRRTAAFPTGLGTFSYRTVQPRLFFGYDIRNSRSRMAHMEKALLDTFYLTPTLKTADDFASLRLDRDVFLEKISRDRMEQYLRRFAQKSLTDRFQCFMEWLKHA